MGACAQLEKLVWVTQMLVPKRMKTIGDGERDDSVAPWLQSCASHRLVGYRSVRMAQWEVGIDVTDFAKSYLGVSPSHHAAVSFLLAAGFQVEVCVGIETVVLRKLRSEVISDASTRCCSIASAVVPIPKLLPFQSPACPAK